MEIRQLRYFLDIARTEHLTQSAQNLFVTQSTLSHGLRQLEQELGVALFDRLGRGSSCRRQGWPFAPMRRARCRRSRPAAWPWPTWGRCSRARSRWA